MSRWKVVFRFETKQVDAMGVTRPMVLTSTRHPGLDLLDFGSQLNFDTPGLKTLHDQLVQHPHMFAFVTNQETDEEEVDQDTASEAQELSSVASDPEVWELVEDLNSLPLPLRDVKEDEESSEQESGWSSTSHEFGRTPEDETETEESEVEESLHANPAFYTKVGKVCTMSKGVKRKTRHHASEIKEAMMSSKQIPRSPAMPKPVRPKEPFKVLEIFTWTMAVTMIAVSRGWIGQEPVTLPRWDLRKSEDRAEAFQYLVRSEPDLLVLAWPCTVWSPLQFLGHMTEERHQRLMVRQQEDRDSFLTLVHDMTKFQRSCGRAHIGENPFQSRAWREPLISAAYDGEGYGRVDMCRYGLRRPDTKELLKKPTQLAGTRAIVEHCEATCNCKTPHAHTVGSYKLNGKSFPLAEFAGGYTKLFAKKIVEGAELYLRNWTPDACTVYAVEKRGLPEEGMMEVDEEVPLQEPQDQEFHESGFGKGVWETVTRVHQRLGHPARDALVRTLKIAGAPKETLDCAKQFSCPVCESKAPPDKPYLQRPRERPAGFNIEVHVDLKYAKNIKEETFVALSMVCAGTNKHAAVLLKTRKASYVAQKFIKHWIGPFGRPARIVMDQGGEFEREWILMLEQFGIHSTTTGSHAGWQHALAERHGAMLGICWHALIVDFRIETRHDMATSLAAALDAKNETVTRQGYSPNMLVFGKCLSYPELLADDDLDPITMAQAMDVDCEMARRSKMRNQARQVLLREDVQQKLKRALQRRPASQDQVFIPGQVIYFYIPNMKPRYRQDHGRWRGPAVVLVQESHQKYYVSWRGRCLLLAAPNMRPASQEESTAHGWIKDEMEDLSRQLGREGGDGKEFEDYSHQEHPPPPMPRIEQSQQREDNARRMMSGMRTVRKLMNVPRFQQHRQQLGILDGRTKEARRLKALKALEDGSVHTHPAPGEVVKIEAESEDEKAESEDEKAESEERRMTDPEDEDPQADADQAEESDDSFWRDVRRQEEEYDEREQEEVRRLGEMKRKQCLDDFPEVLKRRRAYVVSPEKVAGSLNADFYAWVMMAASQQDFPRQKGQRSHRCNSWLNRSELRSLRRLLQLPVKAARVHYAPRKRLQRPPNDQPRKRLSVLLGRDPGLALLVQEEPEDLKKNPKRRAPFLWRGLTLFVDSSPSSSVKTDDPLEEVYVEKDGKTYGVPWDPQKADLWYDFVKEEKLKSSIYELFLLRMKENGKELDPRHFDEKESEAFRQADVKEWESWVKNGVMKLIPPSEAKKIPSEKIFKIPLRWVRVNKNKDIDFLSRLVAKSRLVVPGHADPGLGDFRTDAPTTNPISVRLIKVVAITREWVVMLFDVSTAFLSGYETSREVYARAPKDGLPATSSTPNIPPYALLQILKSAYGLAEAPRLWYLRAAQMLEDSGLTELPFSRSTFVRGTDVGTDVVCALHVDDGILAGDPKSAVFKAVFEKINQRFNIKEWQTLGSQGVDFLGCKVHRYDGYIKDWMKTYVSKIDAMPVTAGDGPLTDSQRTSFRRLVMQLRWPAQHVLPERLYAVSQLAQVVTQATMAHARTANKLLKEFKALAEQGLMELRYYPLQGDPVIVSFFDASLGKSSTTRAQQGQVHLVTTAAVESIPTVANIVEFKSSKIVRVVKSSLAAEGNSLSTATDEQLYLRLLCEALWFGPPQIDSQWKSRLRIPGITVTDAKALFDHLMKTGHMTAEKQTMLDILAAKQLIEGTAMKVAWVPTFRQMADGLTKDMVDELFKAFKSKNALCLKETFQDAQIEAHRAGLRKGQRERRKQRMLANKENNTNTSFSRYG